MAKLKLDLQQLHVQSFSPAAEAVRKPGTVRGHEASVYTCDASPECYTWFAPTCQYAQTCNGRDTCDASCQGTCFDETACLQCTA
jgi:hypothetical protein